MIRFPAFRARKQIIDALEQFETIESLAQAIIIVAEMGHYGIIEEFRVQDYRLQQAIQLINRSTQLSLRSYNAVLRKHAN